MPQVSQQRVAVFGGGPGGLTAAHELAERGFEVDLYERHDVLGGKVRGWSLPGTGTDGRLGLPAEMGPHGFFPGYQHLPRTLGRIPIDGGGTVLDNLTAPRELMLFGMGGDVLRTPYPARSLRTLLELLNPRTLVDLVTGIVKLQQHVPLRDQAVLATKLLALITSGPKRQWEQLEDTSVVDFFKAATLSENANHLLITALEANTEPPDRMNARAYANTWVMMYRTAFDRVPEAKGKAFGWRAPAHEAFLDPWAVQLRELGVRIHTGARLTTLSCEDGRIAGATVIGTDGTEHRVDADYYVLAVPADKAAELMDDALVAADPALGRISLIEETWLGAIQIYLTRRDPRLGQGGLPLDQPWSIGYLAYPRAFWEGDFSTRYGDGTVVDYLSFDLASWDVPGILYGKTAKECTPEEMFEEVRAQLRRSFGDDTLLPDADIHSWYLNPALSKPHDGPVINDEPEFAQTPGCWHNQPEAVTAIPNLFLGASYVRTSLGIDSMDCANEAGRRAANGVLAAAGSAAQPVYVSTSTAPTALKLLWALDDRRYRQGKRNAFDVVAPHRVEPKETAATVRPIATKRAPKKPPAATSLNGSDRRTTPRAMATRDGS